ncbi:MAG TPA: hypothetical protein VF126_15930, partial [Acidobacteriaceae bacterium]
LRAGGRGCDESVRLQLVMRELLLQIIQRALQAGAAVEARAAGDELTRVLERFGAAELRRGLGTQQGKLQQQDGEKTESADQDAASCFLRSRREGWTM